MIYSILANMQLSLSINSKIMLLISAFFTAVGLNIAYVSAQAFLLSQASPTLVIATMLGAALSFTVLLHLSSSIKHKFLTLALILVSLYLLATLLLTQQWLTDQMTGFLWLFITIFYMAASRWLIFELNIRYVNPVERKSFFFYVTTAGSIGGLLSMLLIKNIANLDAFSAMTLSIIPIFIFGLILLTYYTHPKVIEIGYQDNESSSLEELPGKNSLSHQKLLRALFLFLLCIGCFKYFSDYFVKLTFKNELVDYHQIQSILADTILWGTLLVMSVSFATGQWLKQQTLSPLILYYAHIFLMITLLMVCFYVGGITTIVVFEVVRRLSEHVFFHQGNYAIESSLIGDVRKKLRSMSDTVYYVVAALTSLIIIYYVIPKDYHAARQMLAWILYAIFILSILATYYYFKAAQNQITINLLSPIKSASIQAAQVIATLKPKNLSDIIEQKLAQEPKKILRKYLILALGHVKTAHATKRIIQEFQHPHEEIQLATLHALGTIKNYSAVRFILRIMLGKERVLTYRVRQQATQLFTEIYQKKSIPILLDQLEDKDERIIADSLEALASFNEEALVEVFLDYAKHPTPRIRMNALQGLARIKSAEEFYLSAMEAAFTQQNVDIMASAIYVVGRLKDERFKSHLLDCYHHKNHLPEAQLPILAWALIQLSLQEGSRLLINCLLNESDNLKLVNAGLHFYIQLDKSQRMEWLAFVASNVSQRQNKVARLGDILKRSELALHEELEYLNYLKKELIHKKDQEFAQE